jgi:hypothetical protein
VYLIVVRVYFEWLECGAIPVYDLPPSEDEHEWAYLESDEHTCRWNLGRSRRARLILPLGEARLLPFLDFLRQPLPEGAVLMVAVRSVFNLEEGVVPIFATTRLGADPLVTIGLAVISNLGTVPPGLDVELVDGRLPESCLQFIEQFLRIYETTEEPAHPILSDAWRDVQRARERSADQDRRWAEERAASRLSSERALALLKRHLNEVQLQELEAFKGFHVVGADGRTFRIHHAAHGNVFSIENGVPAVNYCIVAVNEVPIPIYDLMLAQKVLLESTPESFFATANAKDVPEDLRAELADPKVSARVLGRMGVVRRERLFGEGDINPEPVAP